MHLTCTTSSWCFLSTIKKKTKKLARSRSFLSAPQKGSQKVTAQGTGLPWLALRRTRGKLVRCAHSDSASPLAPDAAPSSRPNPLGGALDPNTAALVEKTLKNTQP